MVTLRPSRAALTLSAALATAALAAPAPAWAFAVSTLSPTSKTIIRWFSNNVTYYLHPACSPDLKNDLCKDQLRAGFKGWMATPCTALKFTEGYHCNTAQGKCLFDKGSTCAKDADCPAANNLGVLPMGYNTNSRNEIVFIETNAWKFGQYVLGVTSPVTYNNGAIFEADIAMNGLHYKWVADPGSIGGGLMDVLSVIIHEQGHFFGVQHQLPGSYGDKDPPTMAPSVDPFGKSATLNDDDAKAICFLNPKDATYKCAGDVDCPYINEKDKATGKEYYSAKMSCASGACTFAGASVGPVGTSPLGGSCATDKDCKSGLYCQPFGNKGFCSQLCSPQQKNCPAEFTCYAFQNQPTKGACIPTQGNPTQPKKNAGELCGSSSECLSLMCLSGVCRVKCTPSNPVECSPTTESCAPIPATGIGACVPDDKPKLKALGAKCDYPEQCESGICLKDDINANYGICRQACKGKFSCPQGFACVPQTGGFEACLSGSDKLPAGSECATGDQCANGPCVAYSGKQFCSQSCKAGVAGGCPCGMTCEVSTAGDLCLPGKKVGCAEAGHACADSGECLQGLVCAKGACAQACDVRTGGPCGPGLACGRLSAADPSGACLGPGAAQLSDPCAADGDCQSLLCDKDVTHALESRCLRPCDPKDDQCGAGFACNALSEKIGACFLIADLPPPGADAGPAGGVDAGGAPDQVGSVGTGGGGSTGSAMCSAGRQGGIELFGLIAAAVALWCRRRAAG